MLAQLRFIFRYIRYFVKSKDEHSIHSPFVFDLYTRVIRSQKKYYIFSKIETIRKELLQSDKTIPVMDFGAGSRINNTSERKIKDIVRHAEKPAFLAELLFKLILHFKSETIFDLGTSLGLTTLYQASVHKKNKVYTFEGCPETAELALNNFKKLNLRNIELIQGNLEETLAKKISETEKIDFVFFDANHRYEPTMKYFQLCLSKAQPHSVFVFDDIHWSEEMKQAWDEIKSNPRVRISIDLFYIGIIFFRKNQPKQDFILKM